MTADKGERVVIVKNWHVVLVVLVWGVTVVWNYAGLNAQANETARRVRDLEEQRVTKEQFQEFRDDLFRQLKEWQDKTALDRSIQQLGPH